MRECGTNYWLGKRCFHWEECKVQGQCTLPCTLDDELKTNPFLRPEDADIRSTLGALPLHVWPIMSCDTDLSMSAIDAGTTVAPAQTCIRHVPSSLHRFCGLTVDCTAS